MEQKKFISKLGFIPKENATGIFHKKYPGSSGYSIEIDFDNTKINYGKKIRSERTTTQNFSDAENWVVLECVDRLLTKGYKPEDIVLEKKFTVGHGASGGWLDILVKKDQTAYLMIECKTWGAEFDKAFNKLKRDGGQLFTYFQQDKNADVLMLYTSEFDNNEVKYKNEIIKIEEDYRQTGNVKDFFERWNKLPRTNGIFDSWVKPYEFQSKALTKKDLKALRQEDSSFIFNRFLEILRHNVVSDKPNAFNKIFTLFLCKIVDEDRNDDEQLHFQWVEGEDDHISFQKRLTDLYNRGMLELLEKKVTDVSDSEFDKRFKQVEDKYRDEFKDILTEIRLKKNNEFAIKEVYDDASFEENAKVVKEVVELLQDYRIRYNYRQQFLSDFFELLLTTGLKQESGQFFTPVPVARFIIRSIPLKQFAIQKLKENDVDLLPNVIDYAAGSGHFLTESMEEIQRIIDDIDSKSYKPSTAKSIKQWKVNQFDWAEDYVYGVEKDYRLVKTAKVSCYLHGDGLAKVIHGDGLSDFETTKEYKDKLKEKDKTYKQDNKQFDIVVSNPPYSVSAFKGMLTEEKAKDNFDLYKRLTDQSSEIECLFVERTKQLLKDGGVAGIILPSSILSNTGIYTETREIILKYFEIIAITELGSNTFMATGTNTVTLFLKRRNNADWVNIKASIDKFATSFQDITINGIEKPVSKYVAHTWEEIDFADYISLLQKKPSEKIKQHEIYKEYVKKIKSKTEQYFCNKIIELEKEKLLYFILAYPQKVVLIKTGEKKDEKAFLGYEFSNRRGSEGIHPIRRGKSIDECTSLYDPNSFDNVEKASAYIYKAFQGDLIAGIHESLANNVSYVDLVDMMTFGRVDFEKNISLSTKKKVKIESKWEQIQLTNTLVDVRGSIRKIKKSEILVKGETPVITQERNELISGYSNEKNPIIDTPLLLFGDHSCTLKYIDFNFFRGADGTILLKPNNSFIPKYFFYFLDFLGIDLIPNRNKYERHFKYLKNIKIPLPPKEIQEKIVADIEVLEKKEKNATETITKYRKEIETFIKLSSGTLFKLEEITTKIGSGATPLGGESSYQTSGISLIRSQNIYDHGFMKKGLAFISEKQAGKLKNVTVEKDDILFNITGASIARCCVVDNKYLPARVNQHVAIIRTNKKVLPKYLQMILISPKYKNQLLQIGEQATSRQAITKSQLENFKIHLPVFSEQKRIVAKIEEIEEKIKTLENDIKKIPQEKESVLKKYLE
ncbi:MAG: N-6 DNA methylase [bacterium]|nr:N-6 DNA methylase [bacterium]